MDSYRWTNFPARQRDWLIGEFVNAPRSSWLRMETGNGLDLRMPGEDVLQVMEYLRSATPAQLERWAAERLISVETVKGLRVVRCETHQLYTSMRHDAEESLRLLSRQPNWCEDHIHIQEFAAYARIRMVSWEVEAANLPEAVLSLFQYLIPGDFADQYEDTVCDGVLFRSNQPVHA